MNKKELLQKWEGLLKQKNIDPVFRNSLEAKIKAIKGNKEVLK